MAGSADDPEHRAEVFAHIAERHGRLDHLVNNAGINPVYGPVLEIDLAAARKILEVNVLSTLEWTRDAVAAGTIRSVVNISSIAGVSASPDIAFYGVSKAALINLTIAAGGRARTRRPRQRGRAGGDQDSVRPGALRGARGSRLLPAIRCAGSANRRTSRARSRSCCPTTRPGSPARRCHRRWR